MAKPVGKTEGGSGPAATVIPGSGVLRAEPKAEAPAGAPQRRRVLGMQVELLPSRHEEAEKPFPFRSIEDYKALQENPIRNILSRIFESAMVKFGLVLAAVGAPLVQISRNNEISLSIPTYFSQHWQNVISFWENRWENASDASIGFAVAAAAAIVTIGLSIPFISNQPREDMLKEYEQGHEDSQVRATQKSKRIKVDAHKMAVKFRQASFAAAAPLFAFDFASKGFSLASQFFQDLSTSTQVALASFLAFTVVSIGTFFASDNAIKRAEKEENRYLKAKEKAEKEAKDKAAAEGEAEANSIVSALDPAYSAILRKKAGMPCAVKFPEGAEEAPGNVIPIRPKATCPVQPKTEEEAATLEQLNSTLEQREIMITTLDANVRVLSEKLDRARHVTAADKRRLKELEAASASAGDAKALRDALDAKEAEIGKIEKEMGEELKLLKAELAAAKSAKPETAAAPAPPEKVAATEAPAPKEEAVFAGAPPVDAAPEPVNAEPAAAAEVPAVAAGEPSPAESVAAPEAPAAAPEPLRGSPGEGLPKTATDSPAAAASEGPEDYDPGGPAISV